MSIFVVGGTGFIGRALVAQLLERGRTVGVIARNVKGLPDVFHDPRVRLIRGDVTSPEAIARGIGKARLVVNLAHGGASGSREAVVDALVGEIGRAHI